MHSKNNSPDAWCFESPSDAVGCWLPFPKAGPEDESGSTDETTNLLMPRLLQLLELATVDLILKPMATFSLREQLGFEINGSGTHDNEVLLDQKQP